MKNKYKIAVVGLWHLGEIFSAGLAELGHEVIGISEDKKVVSNLNKFIPPLAEPQLSELLRKNITANRLSYTTDFSRVSQSEVTWFAFDAAVDKNGYPDVGEIYTMLEKVIAHLQDGVLVVVSSQIPINTSAEIVKIIKKKRPALKFDYVYTPENLRLGEAVQCFMEPGRVVAGVSSPLALEKITKIFSSLKSEIVFMSPASAELSKHALNAFLATSISFANELADVAEGVGANMMDVARSMRSDPRVGPKAYLNAGLSFSGWTLRRDVQVLRGLVKKLKMKPALFEGVFQRNEDRQKMVTQQLEKFFGDSLRKRKITILGLTYKAGTSALGRSYPMEVAQKLVVEKAIVTLHDPKVDSRDIQLAGAKFQKDIYQAVCGAEAIVVMTPSMEFGELDFVRLAKAASPKVLLYDPTNFFYDQREKIQKAGFKYLGVGIGYDS